jgi:hypothetical protein
VVYVCDDDASIRALDAATTSGVVVTEQVADHVSRSSIVFREGPAVVVCFCLSGGGE